MPDHNTVYRFILPDGTRREIEVRLDPRTLELLPAPVAELPSWTRLEHHQCPNCPLSAQSSPRCPAAVALVPFVSLCTHLYSHNRVRVEIETEERTVTKDTSVQRAFSSLLGLLMATCGCPVTRPLRPMARFHLPLADEEETLYRVTSMYLLAQYFRRQRGEAVDLELTGLAAHYETLQIVNLALSHRLQNAVEDDAAPNALVLLDLLAKLLPYSIEERLKDLQYLFIED